MGLFTEQLLPGYADPLPQLTAARVKTAFERLGIGVANPDPSVFISTWDFAQLQFTLLGEGTVLAAHAWLQLPLATADHDAAVKFVNEFNLNYLWPRALVAADDELGELKFCANTVINCEAGLSDGQLDSAINTFIETAYFFHTEASGLFNKAAET